MDRPRIRLDDRNARQTLKRRYAWLAGQNEAFKAAINGAALPQSLGILARTATELIDSRSRSAFYLANRECSRLAHVVGVPECRGGFIEGFEVGADSFACGL